ncbi:MAG: SGNH/GDSL hydrolase family protein [Clostridia bacterium]|nr:SGNH/GDSL hydrolase family protein [Clostridia bacterium]
MELKNKKFVFLGDSITEGVNTVPFHQQLKEIAGLKEAVNCGIGGTRIARQIEMNNVPQDNDFNMRVEALDSDADGIVVMGGTNDYGHGQAPLGKFEDKDVYTFYGAMHVLCQSLIKKYIDKPIIFMTPLHRHNEYGEGTWKPEGVEQRPLCEYAQAVREVCEHYSIPVLDMFACGELRGNDWGWCKVYMPDGLHPNTDGHKIIAQKLHKFLQNL